MDDPALDPAEHRRALGGLRRINAVSRTAAGLGRVLERRWAAELDRPRRILDIACGGGDVVIVLQRRAQRKGLPWRFDGCDISPTAVASATRAAEAAGVEVGFYEVDVTADALPAGYDCFISMLFLHHLDDDAIAGLLSRCAAAAPLVVMDDLVRDRLGYAMAWWGTRLLSRSRIVHADGPQSVRAALAVGELRGLAKRAGMENVSICRHFPSRMCMVWSRP